MDVEKTKILDRQYWKNIEKHTKTVYIMYMFASLNENHPKKQNPSEMAIFFEPSVYAPQDEYIHIYIQILNTHAKIQQRLTTTRHASHKAAYKPQLYFFFSSQS